MQTSYRWYRLGVGRGASLKSIKERIGSWSSDASWFLHTGATDKSDFDYRFFRRAEVLLEQYDAIGGQSYSRVEIVTSVGLTILAVNGVLMMRLVNPGRNVRALLNSLEGALGFGFWATPITFESTELGWDLPAIEITRVVGLKLVDVAVGSGCVGRMEFASKQGAQIEDLRFLKSLSYKRDEVKVEVTHEGLRGRASIAASGLVKVSGELAPLIRDAVERRISSSLG